MASVAIIFLSVQASTYAEVGEHEVTGAHIYVEELGRYRAVLPGYTSTIRAISLRDSSVRSRALEEVYQRQLGALEDAETAARRRAIEVLESFLQNHAVHQRRTPDVMLRLAELHYQDSYERYLDAIESNVERLEAQIRGEDVEIPEEPHEDLSRTLELLRELIAEFPSYGHLDRALYLLGHCLSELGEPEEARTAWLHLVCGNRFRYEGPLPAAVVDPSGDSVARAEASSAPNVDPFASCEPVSSESRYVDEVWLRVGEHHFDFDYSNSGLEIAISAYRRAMSDPASAYYGFALFRLALSHSRSDRIGEAVRQLVALVERVDGGGTTGSGRDVRPEAIRHLALSFTEDDWDGDFQPDGISCLARLQDAEILPQESTFTSEIYLETAGVLFEMADYTGSIEVYEHFLTRWPLSIEAPGIVLRIAEGHGRNREFDEAFAAHVRLAGYGPDSAWAEANRGSHPELVRSAARSGRDELYDLAVRNQSVGSSWLAQGSRESRPELIRAATDAFRLAARAYDLHLRLFPGDPDRYETTFNAAGAHYYAGDHCRAANAYALVRDSSLDDRLREQAVRGYRRSLERAGGVERCEPD